MTKNISDVSISIRPCTGCQMCAAVCPQNAISISFDEEGFYSPRVNQDLCNNCGLCVKSCYRFDESIPITINEHAIEAYAAFSKDNKLLSSSTSGGVSGHLVNVCIDQGYTVVGVSYNYENNIAVSEIANNYKEGEKFRGSKYMQARTEEIFSKIVHSDKNQKFAIFGTPCHIYALNKWATACGQRERFLFVDLFCHGYCSMYLWKKYLEHIKKTSEILQFEKIEFRSKARGWHEYCHRFIKGSTQVISEKTINDPFFVIFFDNAILGRACYNCLLRSTLQYSDIRLGDFWGKEFDLNTKGVSAVLTCTQKGKKLFDLVKPLLTIKRSNLNDVITAQSFGKVHTYNHKTRIETLILLKSEKDMKAVFKEYLGFYSLKKHILRFFKRILYLTPQWFRNRARRLYHLLSVLKWQ